MTTAKELDALVGGPAADAQMEVARNAFVAGLVHATLQQGGWTVLEAKPDEGRCTVGCAGLFGAGFVADVSIVVRKVDEL